MSAASGKPREPKPEIVLIVAMARNRVIGKDGALPWHIPEDLKRFRTLTMGCPIVMGRKTHDSIGRPLPGRRNIVISRNAALRIDGAETVTSLEAALRIAADADTIFVIGGEQIYRAALPIAHRIELTEVEHDTDGDARFPPIDDDEWFESHREPAQTSPDGVRYCYVTLRRR